jgi:hypothetical protein
MIIAVNGKSVGGMTTTGFCIECDQCGPDMILVVSRYKFGTAIQESIANIERTYLNAVDFAINDNRQVGWTEFGATVPMSTCPEKNEQIINDGQSIDRTSKSHQNESDSDDTMDDISVERIQSIIRAKHTSLSSTNIIESSAGSTKKLVENGFIPIRSGHSKDQVHRNRSTQSRKTNRPKIDKSRNNKRNNVRPKINTKQLIDNCIDSDNDDEADDGNAWCGCVCGETHLRKSKHHPQIFWIQCDVCKSWYDCSSFCVGFTENDAEIIATWTCWGCPNLESSSCQANTSNTQQLQQRSGRVSISPPLNSEDISYPCNKLVETTTSSNTNSQQKRPGRVSISPLLNADELVVTSSESKDLVKPKGNALTRTKLENVDIKDSGLHLSSSWIDSETKNPAANDGEFFSINDFVYVSEHGWAGVNNPEGIARIINVYYDDEDDDDSTNTKQLLYDIKYIIGPKSKGVLPNFVRRHVFS